MDEKKKNTDSAATPESTTTPTPLVDPTDAEQIAQIEAKLQGERDRQGIGEPSETHPRFPVVVIAAGTSDADREKSDAESAKRERRDAGRRIFGKRGKRYLGCRLRNFSFHGDGAHSRNQIERQRETLALLLAYCDLNMAKRITEGVGIVFYGPKGTGKDHLLAAMMRMAIERFGNVVEWYTGAEIFGEFRDAIGGSELESELIEKYAGAKILAISDPVPPFGGLSPYQATQFSRIIDQRYSDLRPTWVTMNVASRDEASERIGSAIADRLFDGAVVLHCNWPSYREPSVTNVGGPR